MSFKEIALPLAARGVPVIPLPAKTKAASLPNWQNAATADKTQIEKWATEYPDGNVAAVAKAEPGGVWFWECDSPDVLVRYKADTGQKPPSTFRVRSRPGRGHFYFLQNAASIAMGNIAQGSVKHGDFSVRVSNSYCVGPQSVHPSGFIYEVAQEHPIVEAPQVLIDWLIAQKVSSAKTALAEDNSPITQPGRNNRLASIGGGLRRSGAEHDEIETILLRINAERCQPPLSESEVKIIANSVSGYAVGRDETPTIGGIPVGSNPISVNSPAAPQAVEPPEPVEIIRCPYPKFPEWVMEGTSLYEGLVKPVCAVNSRYPEFMFMPAMVLLLNYLGTKVRIEYKNIIPSIFLALIGKRGQVIKSSSVEDAIEFLRYAGIVDHGGPQIKNADGKSLVWTVGSPEGLGLDMNRTNCRNAILFYDELSTLSNKCGIDSSALNSALLTLYESGKFQNSIKAKKDSFSLDPGTYCASLIVCSTDKNFFTNWSKLAGRSTGLDDRFFMLYQPQVLRAMTPQIYVDTRPAALETRKLIDRAIQKGVYKLEDPYAQLSSNINRIGNRPEIRAEKFALAFAVDLGLDLIDSDCIDRGMALVEYEIAAKKYFKTFEATTREGALQMEILQCLRQAGGRVNTQDLRRQLHSTRHGTTLWGQAFVGLIKSGCMVETGKGVKSDPRILTLLSDFVDEED